MSTFPGAFVPVAPPADGLRLAFVVARRRRNRKAGATGTAGLLAAVALLASTGGAGDRTLLQEPLPPSTTPGLGVLPGGSDHSSSSANTSAPAAISPVDVALAPRGGVSAATVNNAGRGGGNEQATGSSNRGYHAQGSKAVSGPMTRSSGIVITGNDLTCPARKQQEGQRGFCTDLYASSSSAGTMSITAEICNVGTATQLLSFATARELDLTVRHAGLDVWRWSIGRYFAATPHDITVGVQECVMWQTNWTQVDSHGVRVKAGSYTVVADFDAAEVAGPDRHPSYPITIS